MSCKHLISVFKEFDLLIFEKIYSMKTVATILLTYLLLTSYSQGTDSTYANGQIKYSGTQTNGIYHRYHENGQVMETTHYTNGLKNGEHLEYFENGQLHVKCTYVNGKQEGAYLEYLESGQLRLKCKNENDCMHGGYMM